MADDLKNDAVRSWKRIFTLFGVSRETPTQLQPAPSRDFSAPLPAGAFSDQELNYLPGFSVEKPQNTKIQNIERYLGSTSENIAKTTRELQRFKVLTPEINKAKMVLVPTIMSPNDVQTDSITITVGTEELEPEVIAELNDELTDYFNDGLKLSNKVTDWIGEALFETGAKPVLILPKGPIKLLTQAMMLEEELAKRGEVLGVGFEYLDPSNYKVVEEENLFVSSESFINDPTLDLDIEDVLYGQFNDILNGENGKKVKPAIEAMVKATKENKKNIVERAQDIFTFTTDYRSIVSSKKTTGEKLKSLNKKISESLYGANGGRIFISSDEEHLSDGDHPTLIPMPAEAVIPVCIPGDPSAHIGYFILTDNLGNPLDMTGTGEANGPYNSETSRSKTCSTNATLREGTTIIYGGKFNGSSELSENDQFEAASHIFGITVRKMLENKLRDNDLEGMTIHQHQAVTTTLFQRLIRRAKVKIVFVPATMMAYYAFDYRKDGTGKSLLEESSFLISLRNTMVIANVLTAIKNSTDRTRIEFNVGNQATNVEQLMEVLRDMYVSKRMLNFEHDPLTVARDLIQNSIQMVPKGLRGLEELEVSTENTGGSVSTQPDTDMMEKLSELVTLSMGIPPSALNRLSEDEYSRSIATTNLFFANEIRIKQRVVCDTTTQLVRQYTLSSKPLMEKIINLLRLSGETSEDTASSTDDTVTSTNINDHSNNKLEKVEELLYEVINSIEVKLPTPNIAATKAQYEELREAVDAIDSLVNKLFDEETIAIDDNEAKEAYNAMKGYVRQEVLRRVASELGPHGAIDIPSINSIDQDEIIDYNQAILNLKKGIASMKKNLDKQGEGESGGSKW